MKSRYKFYEVPIPHMSAISDYLKKHLDWKCDWWLLNNGAFNS